MGRYISSNEAIWRILEFKLHLRSPTVLALPVHLENGQRIYFTESNIVEKIASSPKTMLTAFFELCKVDNYAIELLYQDIQEYYTWQTTEKKWQR